MFNFFSRLIRKEDNGNSPRQHGDVDKIINDFVGFIAYAYKPGMIYDVSVLPYKKEYIKEACILWMQNNKETGMAEGWASLFPILSRFQEGIGPKPAGIDYLNTDLSYEEIEKLLWEQESPLRELSKRVDSEYIELYDLACKILQ